MSALNVCRGIFPSVKNSLLAISTPLRRPAIKIFTPFAPASIAFCTAILAARLYEIRLSTCFATDSATNNASRSGACTSATFNWNLFPNFLSKSSRNLSISSPCRPMITPGFELYILIIVSFAFLKICTLDTPQSFRFSRMYFLIFKS